VTAAAQRCRTHRIRIDGHTEQTVERVGIAGPATAMSITPDDPEVALARDP
jgi:hypothetical protein